MVDTAGEPKDFWLRAKRVEASLQVILLAARLIFTVSEGEHFEFRVFAYICRILSGDRGRNS